MIYAFPLLLETMKEELSHHYRDSFHDYNFWTPLFPSVKNKVTASQKKRLLDGRNLGRSFAKENPGAQDLCRVISRATTVIPYSSYIECSQLRPIQECSIGKSAFFDNYIEALLFDFREAALDAQNVANDVNWLIRQSKQSRYNALYLEGILQILLASAILGPQSRLPRFGFSPLQRRTPINNDHRPASIQMPAHHSLVKVRFGNELTDPYETTRETEVLDPDLILEVGRNPEPNGRKRVRVIQTPQWIIAISRSHLTISFNGENWILEDHSTNGTLVLHDGENKSISELHNERLCLRHGDIICLNPLAPGFRFEKATTSTWLH